MVLVVKDNSQPVIKTWQDSPMAPSPYFFEAGSIALPVLLALSLPLF